MPFKIKPTPTITKLSDIERLFKIMATPSNLVERIRKQRLHDKKLLKKLKK